MTSDSQNDIVRIDKWLWAVRLYKTRSQASDACRAGKIKLEGRPVKPAHEAKAGEIYTVSAGPLVRTIRVMGLLHNRVSAKLAMDYLEDLTTKDEYQKLETIKLMRQGIRPAGYGRPAKKERRDLDKFRSG